MGATVPSRGNAGEHSPDNGGEGIGVGGGHAPSSLLGRVQLPRSISSGLIWANVCASRIVICCASVLADVRLTIRAAEAPTESPGPDGVIEEAEGEGGPSEPTTGAPEPVPRREDEVDKAPTWLLVKVLTPAERGKGKGMR